MNISEFQSEFKRKIIASGALYTASNGKRIWTRNIGYNPNDSVELHYNEQGPQKIIINGIEKQIQ
jgi:hypothetical protein